MFSTLHYKFAKGLRDPDLSFTSALLKMFVFRFVNRPMNRYAVDMCDLKRGQKVLDIGSGVGYGIRYALNHVAPHTVLRLRFDLPTRVFGPQWFRRLGLIPIKVFTQMDKDGVVHGIDISSEMVRHSRILLRPFIKADRAEVVQADITHIPLRNSSVDAVFHVESVYFWPSLPDGLREILRVLKPGGVVVTTFSPRLIDRYVRWGWMQFGSPDHLAYAIALEQLGFENVEWIKNDLRAPRGVQCIRARKPALGLLTE
ncbi:unnamed protein product [Hymenolepis diminuta]|uniref:Methyltransf_11 domain-containing protein n=1 Tax=Hymenolepis diminuta TaxID=6216 RepID=A0A158QEC3_HYMDI|nr:unnamed protein product [Hymenolepis diminuta]VUZ55381.1 unnamed protein product [Hymenolepis diminuta]